MLSQLIVRLKSQNAILVYLPDHGETIFDCSDHYGRQINTSDPMRLKTEVEIPLLIYLSPEFRRRNPGKTRTLLNNIRKPLINTDIAHTLLDLADIKTPSLKKEFSLLSDSCPRISRKLFPSATCDYDALKPEIDKIKTYY